MSETKNVIITGANGMIGNLILERCLNSPEIKTVTSIIRKPLGIKHPKLNEIAHTDFSDFTKIQNHFENQHICFYCLGVYTGQVSTADFKKITVDFTKAFGDTLRRKSEQTTFCFLSGQGADSTEKSSVLFAREKGIAENYLLSLKFAHTHIFRPGYIYPVTPRQEPNFVYKLMRILCKPISAVYANIGVTSVQLANKIFDTAINGSAKIIFENKDIREI